MQDTVVADFMSSLVLTLVAEMPIAEAVAGMLEGAIKFLVIQSGIVSKIGAVFLCGLELSKNCLQLRNIDPGSKKVGKTESTFYKSV